MAGNDKPNILALHGEKIALGIFVLAAGFFIYLGINQENYREKLEPDALTQLAQQVKTSIDQDHWPNLKDDRVVETDFGSRVEKTQQPVVTGPYATESPWEYKGKAIGARRDDPELTAPGKPHMVGVLAAMAIKYDSERSYALKDFEDADPIEPDKRPRKNRRNNPARDRGAMGSGSGSMSSGGPAGGKGGSGSGSASGSGYPGLGGDDEGGSGGLLGGGYPGSGGGFPGATGSQDPKTRTWDSKYNLGFDALKLPPPSKELVVPETGYFIAGTALVPHREISKAFDLAFENAKGRNALRDRPTYWEYEVQRADVTDKDVSALADADWKTVITFSQLKKYRSKWAGEAADRTPAIYFDQQLTMPIPPVLIHDTSSFALHPKLPTGDELIKAEGAQPSTDPGANGPTTGDDDEDGQGSGPPGFGPPGLGGRGGLAGGMPGSGMMGSGMMGSGMMGGYGMGASSANPPKYKQVRFYDFVDPKSPDSPKEGRLYVYRVRVALQDPNFPLDPSMQPPLRYLNPEVYAKVAAKMRDAEANDGKRDPRMWTEWSEPSDPAKLPSKVQMYAGPVEPADYATARMGQEKIEYLRKPFESELVAMQWDTKLAAPLIVTVNVKPGGVLAKKATANAIDPLTLRIVKSEERMVDTNTVIIDAIGGDTIEIENDDELTKPGYVLLFDAEGNLKVRSDIEDIDLYRAYSFADEREAGSGDNAGSMPGMGGMLGGDSGGSGAASGGSSAMGGYPGG
jgi:hypothetical protein